MPRKGENIYKRKDGRWEGRYIKARSKTGKAVYGYVYAPTYKEAKRKRSQAIINIEANQTTICKVSETTMPTCFIRKLANDWMNSIQSQIKKSSYVKYYNILHTYILPEFDNVPLSELTSSRIQKFCDDLLTHGSSSGEGLSPKTVLDITVMFLAVAKRINKIVDSKLKVVANLFLVSIFVEMAFEVWLGSQLTWIMLLMIYKMKCMESEKILSC